MFGFMTLGFGARQLERPIGENLVAHWDAYRLNTITESSGDVSQWDDRGPEGWDATEGVASQQPNFTENTLNGKPVLIFDGTDDELEASDVIISGTSARTFFIVAKSDQGSSYEGKLLVLNDSYAITDHGERYDITNEIAVRVAGGNRVFNESLSTTAYEILVIVSPASSNVSATYGYLNGVALTQASVGSRSINTATGGNTSIGDSEVASQGSAFDGGVAEILAYDAELTSNQIKVTERYLSGKWGISV